jgi:predicted transcriptional regulator of viral defense system
MKFEDLLHVVGDLPFFSTGLLGAGRRLSVIRASLGRWVAEGKLLRLHRGVYLLAEPYRKTRPEPLAIAAALKSPSYVSLQSALAWHGIIPEFVPAVTSVTTSRPQAIDTPLGRFEYRHVDMRLFGGYTRIEVSGGQYAFIAGPEKALLDLVYLTAGGSGADFLRELRLQNLDRLDVAVLRRLAEESGKPKLAVAAAAIETIIKEGEGTEL